MSANEDLRMAIYAEAELGEILACLDAGADVNMRIHNGSTPLLEAHSHEMALALLERGADIHAEDDAGRGVFHTLAYTVQPRELANLYKHWGAYLETRDGDGRTPLLNCLASPQGMRDAALSLLDIGAVPIVTDAQGNTALHCWAMGRAHVATGERLIGLGVNPAGLNRFGKSVSDILEEELQGERIQASQLLLSHFQVIELRYATTEAALQTSPRRL